MEVLTRCEVNPSKVPSSRAVDEYVGFAVEWPLWLNYLRHSFAAQHSGTCTGGDSCVRSDVPQSFVGGCISDEDPSRLEVPLQWCSRAPPRHVKAGS
jgi:hypothetical protein